MSSGTLLTRNDGLTTGDALHSVCFLFGQRSSEPNDAGGGCLAVLQRNVPPWEYGKPLKQRLLPARLRRLTHEDSAQSTNWRYRHRSGLYPSGSGDGSRCQKQMLAVCAPAPVTRLSGSASGTCFAGSHSPWSPPFAPPTPRRIAPLCTPASQL